jgi:ABC-type branched-subunit amino acid transport system substrate-binding protein
MALQRIQLFRRTFGRLVPVLGLLLAVSTPAFSATPLTRQEACGRKIYFEGTDCAGKEIKGVIGDLQVSAKLQSCASCHGADGKGRAENGQDPGDITWQYLSVPYGHTHGNGRKHPVFTPALFERAVTTGRDPAGGKLSELMPRFHLSPISSADLVAYLKKISTETDAGVEPTRLVIGNLSPAQGANAETGGVVRDVLSAYFADLNERGGIYGRQIVLRFADSGDDSATTIKDAKRLAAAPVFAMVAPFVPDAEKDLAAMAHANHIPLVGLMALSVPDDPSNREAFYLLPGFQQLEQDLVRFSAVSGKVSTEKTAVVVADTKLEADVSSAMEATWKELGVSKPRESVLSAANGQEMIRELKSQGVETVFFVGEGSQATQWIQSADQADWSPRVFVLGPLMDGSILEEPVRFQGKIYAAYPLLQPELGAVDQFEDFLQRHKFSHDHRLVQISAYCAAKILEDALVRAGHNVTREKLILSLEQLRDFKTGLLPGITYGANRRIGSYKTEIVCVDLVSHSFQPECAKPQTPE